MFFSVFIENNDFIGWEFGGWGATTWRGTWVFVLLRVVYKSPFQVKSLGVYLKGSNLGKKKKFKWIRRKKPDVIITIEEDTHVNETKFLEMLDSLQNKRALQIGLDSISENPAGKNSNKVKPRKKTLEEFLQSFKEESQVFINDCISAAELMGYDPDSISTYLKETINCWITHERNVLEEHFSVLIFKNKKMKLWDHKKMKAKKIQATQTKQAKLVYEKLVNLHVWLIYWAKEKIKTAKNPEAASSGLPKMSKSTFELYQYILEKQVIPTYEKIRHDLQMGRSTISTAKKKLKKLGLWPST